MEKSIEIGEHFSRNIVTERCKDRATFKFITQPTHPKIVIVFKILELTYLLNLSINSWKLY